MRTKKEEPLYVLILFDNDKNKSMELCRNTSYLKVEGLFDALLAYCKPNCNITIFEMPVNCNVCRVVKKALT